MVVFYRRHKNVCREQRNITMAESKNVIERLKNGKSICQDELLIEIAKEFIKLELS